MEKHACKQCGRSFINGRALGGHVRSHVIANTRQGPPSSPAGSNSSRNDDVESKQASGYVLRDNPKKTVRLLEDPDHDYAAASFMFDQSHESEAESSRAPIHGRRSKRARKTRPDPFIAEPEHVTSPVSDVTVEEDVAISLMLLSRDRWSDYEEDEYNHEEEDDCGAGADDYAPTPPVSKKGRYCCSTCGKPFRSYQALGGHRASHKRATGCSPDPKSTNEPDQIREEAAQLHECPFCPRVFSSGQALGGHKRIHMLSAASTAAAANDLVVDAKENAVVSNENRVVGFDLNMPAPSEDDAELSAVSDP